MFKFYRHKHKTDHFTDWVEDKLKDMVLAHKIIVVDDDSILPNGVSPKNLPILSDGHDSWSSQEEIKRMLDDLHQDLKFSRGITSDACYIDPDNPDECL
jgi:hypothetical protein